MKCPHCGADVAADTAQCPSCSMAIGSDLKGAEPSAASPGTPPEIEATATDRGSLAHPVVSVPPNPEVMRRIARLKQWAEAARPLGIELPSLPAWAEDLARNGGDSDTWTGVLRGIERLAQKKAITALETWEAQTKSRLVRLAAYSVDGRLERDQMEDVLHAARVGEVSQALATFQQVDRVISLKERHIDQARDELEHLVSLLRDMQALGIPPPENPTKASEELERELRGGRLAPLKQRLRTLRQEALRRLKVEVPRFVSDYGSALVKERESGMSVDLEAAELARGSREFSDGKVEESLRRLRILAQVHGAVPTSSSRGLDRPVAAPATEVSRRT